MERRNKFLKHLIIKVLLSLSIIITSQGIFTREIAEEILLCGIEHISCNKFGETQFKKKKELLFELLFYIK